MIELAPGAALPAKQMIEEGGVEVGVEGDEEDVLPGGGAPVEGDDFLDRLGRLRSAELAPPPLVEGVDRARSF